jgi:pyruvate dehydrogenase phosphatase
VKDALAAVLATCAEGSPPKPADVSEALSGAIAGLDASIGEALLRLFPDAAALEDMLDEQIRAVINDGGPRSAAVLRGMRGTTVLITLVDPKKENIWVASLGDCVAGKW